MPLTNTKKIQLKNVTLVAVSSVQIAETIKALEYSMEEIEYDRVLFLTHERPKNLPSSIEFQYCPRMNNIQEYNKFMYYELVKYIKTPLLFHIHPDGYIIRPHKWDDAFLQYDYIGAPWPKQAHFTSDGTEVRVGNGACCIKSVKLLRALSELNLPLTDNNTGDFNEDINVCVYHRKALEAHGIRFAPVEIASRFARETTCDDSSAEPFGFHKHLQLRPLSFLIKHGLFADAIKHIMKPILRPFVHKLRSITKRK